MKNLASAGYHLDAIDKEIIYLLMDNAKTSFGTYFISRRYFYNSSTSEDKKLEQAG